MCGIAGILSLSSDLVQNLSHHLKIMNHLQRHRGPDGEGVWQHKSGVVGFAHRRLSIIDLTTGTQPMCDSGGNCITFNGEIYNYVELRRELGEENFITTSDTEVVLQAYRKWGMDCIQHFRGMFAFALWDETRQTLFCARDRFGIKPFYYTVINNKFYFASETKALLPFISHIETDIEGLGDYLTFQFCLAGKTLFKGISELLPAHMLSVKNGYIDIRRYWEVYYTLDQNHTGKYFGEEVRELLTESVNLHMRSDVPVGGYLSGGLDSSSVVSLASRTSGKSFMGFTGKFTCASGFDESKYAREMAKWCGFETQEVDITIKDFFENIKKVIYHLDYPVAGPGSFPQFMVSKLAAQYRKVVLGGQGGDEIFGGYVRYLLAYFEQCIKGAIDGTMHSGNFIVTYESIIPNLVALRNYKPMMKMFWSDGLFEDLDKRYFRLINRAPDLSDEIYWENLNQYSPFETFSGIFNSKNVGKQSYFDLMTHFDFKTLLPALLQVEDRMSMAHGLESRVPFLDHPLVEKAATIPPNIKFKNGEMKQVLKDAVQPFLPPTIFSRKDKMGFPVPLVDWFQNEGRAFIMDTFASSKSQSRELVNNKKVIQGLEKEGKFSRKIWGLLCLELWQETFHDRNHYFKELQQNIDFE